jgi:hypothetical protein
LAKKLCSISFWQPYSKVGILLRRQLKNF